MRDNTILIKSDEILTLFPSAMKEELLEEASRLEQKLAETISYCEDIRLKCPFRMNRYSHFDTPDSRTLSQLETDEQAEELFRFQLQEDDLLNGLFSMKIRYGGRYEAAFHFMKGHTRRTLLRECEAFAQTKLMKAHRDDPARTPSYSRRSYGQNYVSYNLAGQLAEEKAIGRTSVFVFLALTIGRRTKLLRAAAARFHLMTVMNMLDLYDSIGSATPEHIPDLFTQARKLKRHFVIHVGGTNTGKTYDAMKMLAQAPSGVYLCPLRMLAYEGRAVIEKYNVPCSFATGEEKDIDPQAKHISETIGMLDFSRHYDAAVIDECQLISGEDGSLYTNAILGVAADTVYVCCARSGLDITRRLIELCNDSYEIIEHHRSSPLIFEDQLYDGPRRYDAYIVFSRIGAYQMSSWLEEQGMHPSIVYGKLPYEVKMEEARKFEEGETDCLVATDAIAIGQNYNIERIIFRDITKHINRREVSLDSQTVKQVAGRAGRYGRFPVGYVNTFRGRDRDEIREKLEAKDSPSRTAPLELPSFLVETDLPLSLIYKAWTTAEVGEPFVKADTMVEEFICRLIENGFELIDKQDEYNLASLPLDLKDKDQLELLDQLLTCYCQEKSNVSSQSKRRTREDPDLKWKLLLPSKELVASVLKYRTHLSSCEKLCRLLDLAASFFYKIRRDDLAVYTNMLKAPIPKKIAKIMAENIPESEPRYDKKTQTAFEMVSEKIEGNDVGRADTAARSERQDAVTGGTERTDIANDTDAAKRADAANDTDTAKRAETATDATRRADTAAGGSERSDADDARYRWVRRDIDLSSWPTAYIFMSVSGQVERNTGRFPYGDFSKLSSRHLEQSFGNEADYIDYFCYKQRSNAPDYCRYEPYYRFTVQLDPQFIVENRASCYLAERFVILKSEYMDHTAPASFHYYRNDSPARKGRRRRH